VARFVVRRLFQMVFVMFAVSILTFLIFNVIPNGDPAVRMAGRQPTETQIEAIRQEWGFNDNVFVQYFTMMKKVFTGDLVSYFTQLPVGEEILKGLPRTMSLAIGAALLWMFVAICFGLYSAVRAGKFADRFLTIIALIGISMPVFWIGALMNYYLGYKLGWFPNGGYVEFTKDPIDWAYHLILPWTALAILFIGFYSRVLRSNVLDTVNGSRQGPLRAADHDPPRAAQLADPDRDALGARLRGRGGWRGHPHGDRVRPPGGGAVCRRGGRTARRAACARDHAVRRVLHRAAERNRGHRLRLPRPTDPAALRVRAAPSGDPPALLAK
jgi:hypothetical protein